MKFLQYSKQGVVMLIVLFIGLNTILHSLVKLVPVLIPFLIVVGALEVIIGRRIR